LPSVKKFAIGLGGSFGRGVTLCRSGQNFTGPWGPSAMYALEGANNCHCSSVNSFCRFFMTEAQQLTCFTRKYLR
jgi:hypothetical protein